jgi:hypothetical protein
MIIRRSRTVVRNTALITGSGEGEYARVTFLRPCPLVLLAKVGWRQGRTMESEEDTVMGSKLLECVAEEEVKEFGLTPCLEGCTVIKF